MPPPPEGRLVRRAPGRARARWVLALRAGFVLLCGYFAWQVFDGRWAEVETALRRMSGWVLVSLAVTVPGLLLTSRVWHRVLGCYGQQLPTGVGTGIFFLGQVGKYVPGSVWSIGAQAQLTRVHAVPLASVVGTGLVFLAVHVSSALVVGGGAALAAGSSMEGLTSARGSLLGLGLLVVGVGSFHPWVLEQGARLASAGRSRARFRWRDSMALLGTMVLVWALYAAAVLVLLPPDSGELMARVVAAVALSYVAGVLVVVAPAGLGAREALFVWMLAPALGVAPATAVALVSRVVHTVADCGLAAWGAWLLGRMAEEAPGIGDTPGTR